MIIAWTKHLKDPEQRAAFEADVRSARNVLDRLLQLAAEDEATLDRSEMDIKTFDLPNWENRQAFRNGFRACLYKYNKLINPDQKDN